MSDIVQVPLKDIILDTRLQMRAAIDPLVIKEYAENLKDMPPGKIVRGPNGEMWLTWGWHRYHANQQESKKTMPCTVRDGTWTDAVVEAAGGNYEHGVRRTIEDKRRAVAAILTLDEWQNKSNVMIAAACHVSDMLVAKVRESTQTSNVGGHGNSSNPPDTRTGADGIDRPVHPKKRGRPEILCDPCRHRIDIGRQARENCEACWELRNAHKAQQKRKPDDKTPEEPTNGKAPKPGDPLWKRDKEWEQIYGSLVRFVQDRSKSTGKGITPPSRMITLQGHCHKIMMDLLEELIQTFKLWKKGT